MQLQLRQGDLVPMLDDLPVPETEEVKILHTYLLSGRRHAEQLAAVCAGRGIPHRDVIALSHHLLNRRFDIR